MFQVALPCYLGLNSGRPVSINVNKTRKHFSRNIHGARMFPQCSPVSHTGNIVSSVSAFVFKMQIMLTLTAGNFNENPSMRALPKILRARASEHSCNFCEQFEQRPNFASTFKLDGTISSIPLMGKNGYFLCITNISWITAVEIFSIYMKLIQLQWNNYSSFVLLA